MYPTKLFPLVLAVPLLVSTGAASGQTDMGTAFTYQGMFVKHGAPVTDVCTFEFEVWDAASGGNQIGPTLPANTAVTDGYFKAILDY